MAGSCLRVKTGPCSVRGGRGGRVLPQSEDRASFCAGGAGEVGSCLGAKTGPGPVWEGRRGRVLPQGEDRSSSCTGGAETKRRGQGRVVGPGGEAGHGGARADFSVCREPTSRLHRSPGGPTDSWSLTPPLPTTAYSANKDSKANNRSPQKHSLRKVRPIRCGQGKGTGERQATTRQIK